MSRRLHPSDRDEQVAALRRSRPRSRFVRTSLVLFAGFMIASWWLGDVDPAELFAPDRQQSLDRFLDEIRPHDLEGKPWSWRIVGAWAGEIMASRGEDAIVSTLAISVLAIFLAGSLGLLFSLPAARNFARSDPFLPTSLAASRRHRVAWRCLRGTTRLILTLLRALPEYVWAFLLLAMTGPNAWPAVLALAIHNLGILGRLNAETIENSPTPAFAALRTLGASRGRIALFGLFPTILPRFLLYFFYRWETCVRETTVLGMLGIASLGYWIAEARARDQADTLVFLVLLGSLLVLAGDLLSALARRLVRNAG